MNLILIMFLVFQVRINLIEVLVYLFLCHVLLLSFTISFNLIIKIIKILMVNKQKKAKLNEIHFLNLVK